MPKASHSRPAATAQPRLRRGYFECRYGQLHVHNAIPAGGGFEEGTPLLCLHPIPHSGSIFERFLTVSGATRSVFAPDMPGFGNSDPPPARAGVPEHAAAIGDFLETMRLRQVDLLGQGFGAAVAAELAATRPAHIRRLVLVSPPLTAGAAEPPPMAPMVDGSHLLEEWRRAVAHCGPGAPAAAATAALAERLHNGPQAASAAAAESVYQLRARLAQLAAPLLVMRLGAEVGANKGQSRDVPARTRFVELPDRDTSIFETAPEVAAQAVESFLR
jgi:pimeloyl-ACP methyl ester carboxylesterase